MRKYSVLFFIKQSLNGLFMNRVMSLTSMFILTSCLLLMGCFGFFIYNININLEDINQFNEVVFFIDESYSTDEQIESIKTKISELPNVSEIRFVSGGEAFDLTLNRLFPDFTDSELAAKMREDNTIHDSIVVKYENIDDLNTLLYQLENTEGKYKVRNKAEIAEFIRSLRDVVRFVLVWFLVILFVIAIFIILNTVKLSVHSRKDEIKTMRYIGATNFFIMFPFLLEGIIIGVFSAVAAYFLQWYVYNSAIETLVGMEMGLKFIYFSEVSVLLFVIFAGVGVMCGLLGSSLSANKYLKA